MSVTHQLSFTVAELEGCDEFRVPVRASNTRVLPGVFEDVLLETGRGRPLVQVGATLTEIRAQAMVNKRQRWVTLSPRYEAGDYVQVTVSFSRRAKVLYRIKQVHGRRVRDVLPGARFDITAWADRHGNALLLENPWCWCLIMRKVRP